MREICRSVLLRNFLSLYSKRSYFFQSEIWTRNQPVGFHTSHIMPNRVSSSNVSPLPNIPKEYDHLVNEFPSPKKILWRLLNEAYIMTKNPDIQPIINVEEIRVRAKKKWKFIINMRWPENFHVEGISKKKHEAENLAYLHACQKMKEWTLLDKENKPLIPGKENTFNIENIRSAKSDLHNIFQMIFIQHYRNPKYLPKFEIKQKEGIGKETIWECQLHVAYPEEKSFESSAIRLKDAENIVAAQALLWLEKTHGVINSNKHLIRYSKEEEEKLFKNHSAPYSIWVPSLLQKKMSLVLHRMHEMAKEKSCLSTHENCSKEEDINSNEMKIFNLITDEIYCELSEAESRHRSHRMFQKYVFNFENSDPNMKEIKNVTSNLPIYDKKLEILKLVNENQVIVLSGETGCGKTTQVPQYILDEYIGKFKGADCNIIVSQPRRISAISIAERIAVERDEQVGESVGYHVRLNKNSPKESGAILFCSTGMLLRKLCFNPYLHGISHVIVDEVHERSFQIDILLILLKRILASNKNIRIIIMSASFNTPIFSQYFNNCPIIHIPGNVYPVKQYYLDDLPPELIGANHPDKMDPILNVNLVAKVINHVHSTQEKGAILCFLPGWHDILAVKNKIIEICEDPTKLKICCAHSRLPVEEQKMIFDSVPDGIRKIILATNVAETSITINDVVYVVDSGLHKGTTFHSEQGVASLGTQWITQANVRQRLGRAGRVQHGVCYHLFPQRMIAKMDQYPNPEILRMPLESVILDCKLYCPDTKAEDFLSTALQPPSQSSLQIGVHELQISGVLDKNENLTDLGRVIVNFATHPRLSIALIYASFLGCLDPVLTICAVLTLTKEPFLNTLKDGSLIKTVKWKYDNGFRSDHLAMTKIFDAWNELEDASDAENFVLENLLDEQNLQFARDLKALFAESLFKADIIDSADAFLDPENICNINQHHLPTIFSVLSAAFYPNVMKIIQGEISRGKILKDGIIYSIINGQRGYIQRESVASKEFELPSPWLVYFKALHSEARRMMMTPSVSSVPGICLLLFSGQELTIVDEESNNVSNNVILKLDGYKKMIFSCKREEAELLLLWRNQLRNLFRTYIQNLKSPNNDMMSFYNEEFLPVLKEIISTPQVPFIKGEFYKFVNNELVLEDFEI